MYKKLFNKQDTSLELHLPFMNYMGPGTHVAERLRKGITPNSHGDAVALVHDIEYYGIDERLADANAVHNAKGITKAAMYLAFGLKNIFGGMKPERDQQLYSELISYVQNTPVYKNILDKYDIKFFDTTAKEAMPLEPELEINFVDSDYFSATPTPYSTLM